jgi:replicative DNA helicase
MSMSEDPLLQKGLPHDNDAERLILGAILLDPNNYEKAAAQLDEHHFHSVRHKRIWRAISAVFTRGEAIDRITVASELQNQNLYEAVGGLSYLVSLDDFAPRVFSIDSYIPIIKEKAALRALARNFHQGMNRALLGGETSDEIVRDLTQSLLEIRDTNQQRGLRSFQEIVDEYDGGINALLDPSRRRRGARTGFHRFDEMTGGLREGELIVLAGRPSMGKTSLAMDITRNIATHPDTPDAVAVFSLEMSRESLMERMACAASMTDSRRFRGGFLDKNERMKLYFAFNSLAQAPIFVDDSASAGLFDIALKARRIQAEHGLGLIVIDYLQLMSAPPGKGKRGDQNRNYEIGLISRGLKIMAKDLRVPVLVLSQLSRAPEQRPGDHRPQLSDLRDSGAIEQDADLVAFVYREEVYRPDRDELKGHGTLILAKQRNGPVGDIPLVFFKESTRFENAL